MAATWIDLLDPTLEELKAKAPSDLEPTALAQLLAAPQHEDEPRPTLQGHGDYVFGVFLVAVIDRETKDVYYQEIDIVGHARDAADGAEDPGERLSSPATSRPS